MEDEQETREPQESIGDDRPAAQAGLAAGHSMQGGTAPPGPGGSDANQDPSEMENRGSMGDAQDGSAQPIAEDDVHGSKANASAALAEPESAPSDT